jgi:hypothetical protein
MPDDTFPRNPRGLVDAGHMRDENERKRQEICTARLPNGVFCTRFAGHGEACNSVIEPRELEANTFGPEQALKRGWGR